MQNSIVLELHSFEIVYNLVVNWYLVLYVNASINLQKPFLKNFYNLVIDT